LSTDFSKGQVLKSLTVFNSVLELSKLRDNLNSTSISATVDFITQMLEKLSVASRLKTLTYADVAIISSTISSISTYTFDKVSTPDFNKIVVLQGVQLPKFIRAFSASLLPRLDDVYILNSRIKIAVSKRFQTGQQLVVASSSLNALPRATLHSNASTGLDGSEVAVLFCYGLVTKVSPAQGMMYTTVVDFSVYRSTSNSPASITIEFSIDEVSLQLLRSDIFLSNSILLLKSRVHEWNFKENSWMLQKSCSILTVDLIVTGTVVAVCPYVSASPKAVAYSPDQSVCSDGFITGSEVCDDGNLLEGDGCDSDCNIEKGWQCELKPSKCKLLSK
jgi:cysteine-rich repeat protein